MGHTGGVSDLPVIDLSPLRAGTDVDGVAARIDDACRRVGFFTVVGHGVDPGVPRRLDALARRFFALPERDKARIAMAEGGRAWRGWFPLGGELTGGVADGKEGLYLGEDLGPDDDRVAAGWPLHGANLYPAEPPGLAEAVEAHLGAVTEVGHLVLRGMALGLGLDPDWFDRHLTARPLVMLRVFHYPPVDGTGWSVGEHTDYGLLTVLWQDGAGGLEVRGPDGWLAVPPDPSAFVINLGDMLERMTAGAYRSTPHRVRNTSRTGRISIPLFLDPAFDAEVRPVPGADVPPADSDADRWDGASVHDVEGPYGDYLLSKVSKVFPALAADALDPGPARGRPAATA